jgi:hypothetical protein
MPRKQRFKPSRKPKAVGTLTDLMPLDGSAAVIAPSDPARPQDVTHADAQPMRGDADGSPPVVILGSEPS